MENTITIKENRHEHKSIQKNHSHSYYQILFVLDNSGTISLNGTSFLFNEGTLVFIPPRAEHSIESYEKMIVLDLEFASKKLDSLNQELLDESLFNEPKLYTPSSVEIDEVKRILRRMLYENSKNLYLKQATLSTNLAELFVLLLRVEKNPPKTTNELRASGIQRYIDTHYYEIYGVEQLANKFKLSTKHLTNIFKEQYLLTPRQYVNKVRINEAEKLLIQTDNEIITICFEVGYESLATFYRQFKTYTGLAPKVFRNQFQNK